MTLQEAETDERFQQFKFWSMLELGLYITKCRAYIAKNSPDYEVQEYLDAAVLINAKRIGKPIEEIKHDE